MKSMKNFLIQMVILSFVFSVQMMAQKTASAQEKDKGQQEKSVFEKVDWKVGPTVGLIDKWATIDVPEGYLFANGADTKLLMEAMGNPLSDQEVGFFAPNKLDWFVVFEFDKIGYVKDDDKNDIDAAAILTSFQKGAEENNKFRKEKGYPTLEVVGWEVPPHYNEQTHNLEWAIRAKEGDTGAVILNHNIRILGRKGVMKSTLVVDPDKFETALPLYNKYLESYAFKSGEKYAEYSEGDKLAGYGLSALVAGGAAAAAAKFGLLGFLGKYIKIIVLGIVGFFAVVWGKIKSAFKGKESA